MKRYINNETGEVKAGFEIGVPMTIDGEEYTQYNATEETILATGLWALADTREEDYEERVVELIRQRYTVNQELAILRQRDTKADEFGEYNSYVEECKATARKDIFGE